MGACFINGWLEGKNEVEARKKFADLQERCRYMYGHDPYNGTWSTTSLTFENKVFDTLTEANYYAEDQTMKREAVAVRIKGRDDGWYIAGWAAE